MEGNKILKKGTLSLPSHTNPHYKREFPIVGIGASAGGLEALEQFFHFLPHDSGMAFVVVQHLDPNHVGMMPELLQRTTQMKVSQATDNQPIQINQVYVIPPNKSLSILNGHLLLMEPIESRGLRLPIDVFFHSLANDQNENAVGIILSGMGSDGSMGLASIKEKNGITMVQDPSTAKFDGMPKSALHAVHVDIMAPANELPARLISIIKHIPNLTHQAELDVKTQSNLNKVILLLKSQTGHDFSLYKKNTLYRRIERRMIVHQIDKITFYIRYLQENPTELDILFKELLIGVTNFFRDPAVWLKLQQEILPEIINKTPNNSSLRGWISGCSTGEEAFSFAISFKEALEKAGEGKNISLQIFATDIDSDAVDKARKSFYPQSIIADVPAGLLIKYFTKTENGYQINTNIREMVVFAPHNMIKDPPFTKLDFLLCRNVLIYMESELQRKLINLFHYCLNNDGILLLGSAENDSSQGKLFVSLDQKLKLFKRAFYNIKTELLEIPSSFTTSSKKSLNEMKPIKSSDNLQALADQLVLQNYAPPSVLINSEGDILYITGRTGKYLEPAAGKANMNIYAMAREGLRNELPGAIRKAKESFAAVKIQNIKIGTNGGTQTVELTLHQIEKPESIKGTIMIVFSDVTEIQKIASKRSGKNKSPISTREQQLELELQRVQEELQTIREEMQTTQEELKSTNEEMQSTNEELQSTNEELTTSKEEKQSLNEELQTVNIELQSKIADFMVASNDMKNLLNSTDIATLFLDKELNIRRYTDQLTELFKLRHSDIGRPFTDMVTNLQYPKLINDTHEVLRTLVFKETAIQSNDARWYRVRIMPYRTADDHIDGLVITFIDISEAKQMEQELQRTIAKLRELNTETT